VPRPSSEVGRELSIAERPQGGYSKSAQDTLVSIEAHRMAGTKDKSWRAFEKMVARIEEALAPAGAVVKSPDRILDSSSGTLREVDASIRFAFGTSSFLIILECRERVRVQDVQWIEQLAIKKQHTGANHCIAVTSSRFSRAAVKKAEVLAIELRRIEEVTAESLRAPVEAYRFAFTLKDFAPRFALCEEEWQGSHFDKEVTNELIEKYYLDDRFIGAKDSAIGQKGPLSPRDCVALEINRSLAQLSRTGRTYYERGVDYEIECTGERQYRVSCSKGLLDIVDWKARFVITWLEVTHPVARVFTYHSDLRTKITGIEIEADRSGSSSDLTSIHLAETDKILTLTKWGADGRVTETERVPLEKQPNVRVHIRRLPDLSIAE
jgi:hypothetical protein